MSDKLLHPILTASQSSKYQIPTDPDLSDAERVEFQPQLGDKPKTFRKLLHIELWV